MNAVHLNGRKRPTLNDQIIRLDSILDGLAENLNEAVADAVKEAVGIAVKEAIQSIVKEVVGNKEVMARLMAGSLKINDQAPAKSDKRTGIWARLIGLVTVAWEVIKRAAKSVQIKTLKLIQTGSHQVAQLAETGRNKIGPIVRSIINRAKKLPAQIRTYLGLGFEMMKAFRKPLLIAVTIGTTIGVGSYLAGPVIASTISGFAGFIGSLFGYAWRVFRSSKYSGIVKHKLKSGN